MRNFFCWVDSGPDPLRVEAFRGSCPDSNRPEQCTLEFVTGNNEFTLHNQTAASLEAIGLAILDAAQKQRDADALRARVADPAYTPTLAEALRHPDAFVAGMTETSQTNHGIPPLPDRLPNHAPTAGQAQQSL